MYLPTHKLTIILDFCCLFPATVVYRFSILFTFFSLVNLLFQIADCFFFNQMFVLVLSAVVIIKRKIFLIAKVELR